MSSFEEAWSLVKEMNTVRCNKCMWKGEEEDLVMFEDEDGAGKGCPKCETDAYLMDLDELNRWPHDEFSNSIDGQGQLSDGSPMEDMGKKVQELHGLLSQATTLAEQCCGEMSDVTTLPGGQNLGEMSDVEDMIVGAQAALNEMHPGSEEEYYGRP